MEYSASWLASLVAIILVDLLLAGDNAVVIALAARRLPAHLKKRAVWAGTAGAIIVRFVLVLFALSLLKLPWLSLIGGLVLYWIAWRLLMHDDEHAQSSSADTFWAAMRTIIIADTVMGLDNILAIAGASRGDWVLVIIGFLISIPIMVAGSLLILKLMQKAPWLITLGCGLLAIIAGRMILDDWRWREIISLPEKGSAQALDFILWEWSAIVISACVFTSVIALLKRLSYKA